MWASNHTLERHTNKAYVCKYSVQWLLPMMHCTSLTGPSAVRKQDNWKPLLIPELRLGARFRFLLCPKWQDAQQPLWSITGITQESRSQKAWVPSHFHLKAWCPTCVLITSCVSGDGAVWFRPPVPSPWHKHQENNMEWQRCTERVRYTVTLPPKV